MQACLTEAILQEEIDFDDKFEKTVMEKYDWNEFEKYVKQSKTTRSENVLHKLCQVFRDTSDLETNADSYLNGTHSETDAKVIPLNKFSDLL